MTGVQTCALPICFPVTIANGNKVLFLEEVQSDWGQTGKKEGFDSKDIQRKELEKTNYPAQVQQLKKAGLNPALMYGTAGAGGQTAAAMPSANGGNGGNNFSGTGQEILGMMMAKSQIDLNEAQAKKTGTDRPFVRTNDKDISR